MLKVREVNADGDGGFGMAAVSEEWSSARTGSHCSAAGLRLGLNITARVASRRVTAQERYRDWNDGDRSSGCSGDIGERWQGCPDACS